MNRWAFLSGLVLMSLAVGQLARKPSQTSLATAFLKSLSPEQRGRAVKAFEDDYRTHWQYVPATRQGINFNEMTPDQAKPALALLKESLSESGYKKTEVIKSLEDVLFQMENGNKGRDKGLYTFTFFGEPSLDNT